MKRFDDQVAIVTGAGMGIGHEIARQLVGEGASVLLNDVDADLCHEAAFAINRDIGPCLPLAGDASDLLCINRMVETCNTQWGRLDIAVANAGITTFGQFLDYKESSLDLLMNVNLKGSFFLAQAAARNMIKNEKGGRILFMSSVTGHQAHPNLAAYGMTKAALEMLAKNLGVELAPQRITVNTIVPGATMTARTAQLDPEYQNIWESITPTGKVCTTKDIAHAALFLLSKHASQITGQSLIVDGGWTSVSPPPEQS